MKRSVLLLSLLAVAACKKRVPEAVPEVSLPPAAPAPKPPVEPEPVVQRASLARVHFAYDSSALSAEARSLLEQNARTLAAHPEARVELQGHCDERGTTEYNLALGQRRAAAAKSFLVAQGVSANRINTVSYGEERPLSQGATESAWSLNRRAELRVTSGGGDGLEGSTP